MTGGRRPWNVPTERPIPIHRPESPEEIEFCLSCPYAECSDCLERLSAEAKMKKVRMRA